MSASASVGVIAILSVIVLCLSGFLLYKHVSASGDKPPPPPDKPPPPPDKPPPPPPPDKPADPKNPPALDVRGEWALTSVRGEPFPYGEWEEVPDDPRNDYRMFFGSTANSGAGEVVITSEGERQSGGLIQQKGANTNAFEISWPVAEDVVKSPNLGDEGLAVVFSPPPGSSEMPVGSSAVVGGGKGYMILTKISNRQVPVKST